MRRVKRVIVLILIVMLCMPLLTGVQTEAADGEKHLDVLFTHDTHSHLNSYSTIVNGKQKEVGGFARIKTLIDEKKKENPDTLILDGGDFSMGTLIQTVYTTEAAELRMLGYLGCDVTTFGNHEFDYRSSGLADMLKTAKNSGETVPKLVVCNVDWDAMEKEGLSKGQKQIESAFETYGVKDYVVIQKGGVKIAVLGVFGKDALECAPTCELEFKDPVESAKNTVEEIKKKEDVDMIACVSHSGTWEDEKVSEDETLAKEVPDIDLIISGHTHTQLDEPIRHLEIGVDGAETYLRNSSTRISTKSSHEGGSASVPSLVVDDKDTWINGRGMSSLVNFFPGNVHRMTAGTKVLTAGKTGTSRQLFSNSEINSLLGVSNSSNGNTAVMVSNGDGAATGVHVEGCTYQNGAWHTVFNTNIGSVPIRINYIITYWG